MAPAALEEADEDQTEPQTRTRRAPAAGDHRPEVSERMASET